jgi:flagellar biosynthesis protein FlhF
LTNPVPTAPPAAARAPMKLKSYFANSIEDAVAQASRELGDEAILVHSRRTPAELRHQGPYEVVFAAEPPRTESGGAASKAPAAAASPDVTLELVQIRHQLEALRRLIEDTPSRAAAPGVSAEASPWMARLEAAGIEPRIASDIAALWLAGGTEPSDEELTAALAARLPAPSGAKRRGAIRAFTGPAGSGKTSLIVKQAVRDIADGLLPLRLISLDTFRVGGADQLRAYASILGCPMEVADSPAALDAMLAAAAPEERIYLDLPGLAGADLDQLSSFAAYIATRRDIDCYVTLPATARLADLKRLVQRYQVFRPSGLAFTRLDETSSFGELYSLAVWTSLPVEAIAAGQQIPEDLETPTPGDIARWVLGGRAA